MSRILQGGPQWHPADVDLGNLTEIGQEKLQNGGANIPILYSTSQNFEMIDASWLCSNQFSWHYGPLYKAVWEHLIQDLDNSTTEDIQTDYVYANFSQLDQMRLGEKGYILSNQITGKLSAKIDRILNPENSTWCLRTRIYFNNQFPGSSAYRDIFDIPSSSSTARANWTLSCHGNKWHMNIGNGSEWLGGVDSTDTIPAGMWLDVKVEKATPSSNIIMYESRDGGATWTAKVTLTARNYLVPSNGAMGILGPVDNTADHICREVYIDLSQTYFTIENQVVWTGMQAVQYVQAKDGHKICAKTEMSTLETMYNKYHECTNYFIIDRENQLFKLPRNQQRKVVYTRHEYDFDLIVYSDGWVEQSGVYDYGSLVQDWNAVVSLPFIMIDNKYELFTQLGRQTPNNESGINGQAFVREKQPAYFVLDLYGDGTSQIFSWKVQGYADLAFLDDATNRSIFHEYYYMGKFIKSPDVIELDKMFTALNNKLDLNIDNMTDETRKKIIHWNIPDYNSGISVGTNTDYAVPSDGFFKVFWGVGTNTFTINGSTVATYIMGYQTSFASNFLWPVKKGDIVKVTLGNGVFYPSLGVSHA